MPPQKASALPRRESEEPDILGMNPEGVEELITLVENLRAESELQLRHIAELNAQHKTTLASNHRTQEPRRPLVDDAD